MILIINAIVCFAIAIRLFFFRKNNLRYRFLFSFLAWLLICSSGSIAVLILFHKPSAAEIPQTIMNIIILICVMLTEGNVTDFISRAFKKLKGV